MLVDGDTGYGEALNVMHMVRAFEDAGAGAVHIEDQLLPKKCGHLNDKKLAAREDMAAKIAAAARARRHLFIIARTDAAASEGTGRRRGARQALPGCGRRCDLSGGVDHRRDVPRFRAPVDAPLLANMTEFGRTPYFTAAEFEAMGYRMVIWPVSALRIAAKAQEQLYATIRREDGPRSLIGQMQTRQEL